MFFFLLRRIVSVFIFSIFISSLLGGQTSNSQTDHQRKHVPFEKYKKFYNKYNTNLSRRFFNGYLNEELCKSKGALIEFVFLKKGNKQTYHPYPVDSFRLERKDDSKCGDEMENFSRNKKTFRFLEMINNGCHCRLMSGVTYILRTLGDESKLHYEIQLPEEKKLNFRKTFNQIQGTKRDTVYRIPLIVNEILETKSDKSEGETQKRKETKKYTFKVRGINHPTDNEKIAVLLYLNDKKGSWFSVTNEKEPFSFSIKTTSRKKALGGSIAVFHRLKNDAMNNRAAHKIAPIKLRQYKKNIATFKPNISQNLDFQHKGKKWIKRTIVLDPYLEKKKQAYGPIITKVQTSVSLVLEDPNQNLGENSHFIPINVSQVFSENDQLKAKVIAPPGTYDLVVSPYLIKKSIQWPPEQASKGAGNEKSGKK